MILRNKPGSVLGGFGKGIQNSISLNFGQSAGKNCDLGCQHHPENDGSCYAVRIEIRPDRKQLSDKLERHEKMRPAMICGRAILEINHHLRRGIVIPWLRLSTNGSLPQPADVRDDNLFKTQFRALIQLCVNNNIPVHVPVESSKKARFYRSLVGDLVTIRESIQRDARFNSAVGAVSIAVGTGKLPDRIETAKQTAKLRTDKTGRKTIVCPAVVAGFKQKLSAHKLDKNERLELKDRFSKAKCGSCTACAQSHVDIVYPIH